MCKWHRRELKSKLRDSQHLESQGCWIWCSSRGNIVSKATMTWAAGAGCWGAQPPMWASEQAAACTGSPRPVPLQVSTLADDVLASVQRGNYTVLPKLFSEFQSDAALLNCFVLWLLILWCGWSHIGRRLEEYLLKSPRSEWESVTKAIFNSF